MEYKVGDRVKVICYDGIEGTIIEIRESKHAYKIHFDNRYLLDAYYSEDELQPLHENNYNIVIDLNHILDIINKDLNHILDIINKELNNIIKIIDNNK